MSKPPKMLAVGGGEMPLGEFARAVGLPKATVVSRLRAGWTPERIAATPKDEMRSASSRCRACVATPTTPDEDPTAALSYTCPRCGGSFAIPTMADIDLAPRGKKTDIETRPYVRLGGQRVCEECASRRFPRRPDSDRVIGERVISPGLSSFAAR